VIQVLIGDALEKLRELPSESVHCVVTSPPYWGLRDYSRCSCLQGTSGDDREVVEGIPLSEQFAGRNSGNKTPSHERKSDPNCPICKGTGIIEGVKEHQLGLEKTPEEYVQHLVEVFREVKRVLRDDGTFWLNLGDCYYGSWGNSGSRDGGQRELNEERLDRTAWDGHTDRPGSSFRHELLKPKDLVGIPWTVARALRSPYYTGTIRNERERIWLAALLETEGTICGFYHIRKDDGSPRTGVHLHITNCDQRLLDEAVRIFPSSAKLVHLPSTESHLGKRDVYRWHVFSIKGKKQLIAELYPHLIAKRKQAVVAWNLLGLMESAKHLGHTSQKDGVRDLRKQMVEILSSLNSGVDVVLPEWMNEPPSLYEEGWYLRSDIIWNKPNPMPESVTDRPTKSHEYIFLLTKSSTYFYDQEAIREPAQDWGTRDRSRGKYTQDGAPGQTPHSGLRDCNNASTGRNRRTVWEITTQPFPMQLIEGEYDYVGRDGKPYIVSPDCPLHGHWVNKQGQQKGRYDGRPTSSPTHNADKRIGLVSKPEDGSVSTPLNSSCICAEGNVLQHSRQSIDVNKKPDAHFFVSNQESSSEIHSHTNRISESPKPGDESSGYSSLDDFPIAISHSMESHKRLVGLDRYDNVSEETPYHKPDNEPSSSSRSQQHSRHENNTSEDFAQDAHASQRSVCRLDTGTEPSRPICTCQEYKMSHFATFPPELPETCIKAGTSQKGCCPKCGAPWERLVGKERYHAQWGGPAEKDAQEGVGQAQSFIRNSKPGCTSVRTETFGWQPTCECKETETIPCTVLDPFAGSGTVGWVARSLGRKAILIDLNPIYGDLIRKRAMTDVPDLLSFDEPELEEADERQLGDGTHEG